jgi:uncharacterized protein (DUF924 family)
MLPNMTPQLGSENGPRHVASGSKIAGVDEVIGLGPGMLTTAASPWTAVLRLPGAAGDPQRTRHRGKSPSLTTGAALPELGSCAIRENAAVWGTREVAIVQPEDILAFWFPPGLDADEETHRRQFEWWFRGGADQAILERYEPVLQAASRGDLDHWAQAARSRVALVIVLDQFSRTVYRETAQAFAQDSKAVDLAIDGLERGYYAQLPTVWEKTFFVLPLGHFGADRAARALCSCL